MVTEIPRGSLLEPLQWAIKYRGVLARRCITCGPRPPWLVSRRMAEGPEGSVHVLVNNGHESPPSWRGYPTSLRSSCMVSRWRSAAILVSA